MIFRVNKLGNSQVTVIAQDFIGLKLQSTIFRTSDVQFPLAISKSPTMGAQSTVCRNAYSNASETRFHCMPYMK